MNTLQHAIETAPAGTTGLVVAPWSEGEVHGVAADWSQASSVIHTYGSSGWEPSQYQVADFRHSPREALDGELRAALFAAGDDEDDAANVLDDATDF